MLIAVLLLAVLAAVMGDRSLIPISILCGGYVALLLLLFWIDAKRGRKTGAVLSKSP
jgi:hypothetical protein